MEVTDQLKTMPSNLSLVNDVEMEVGERIMKTLTNFLWLCSGEGERARGDAAGTKEVHIIYM